MFGTEFDDLITKRGFQVTLKHKTIEYYGNPVAVIGSFGAFPAGTYYWRANPVVNGVEQGLGKETKATLTLNQKVTLTLPNLGVGITFNVYRSDVNTRSFTSPCLIAAAQSAGSFVDVGNSTISGEPLASSEVAYPIYSTTHTKCLRKRLKSPENTPLEGGLGPTEQWVLSFKSDETVDLGDIVTMGNFDYMVNFWDNSPSSFEKSTVRAYIERSRLQV